MVSRRLYFLLCGSGASFEIVSISRIVVCRVWLFVCITDFGLVMGAQMVGFTRLAVFVGNFSLVLFLV